jgi:hypothetical protein
LKRGEQRHEGRDLLAGAKVFDLFRERSRQDEGVLRAGERLSRRPRPIGGQIELRRIAQVRLPVRQVLLPLGARGGLSLPTRKLGILTSGRGERVRFAA